MDFSLIELNILQSEGKIWVADLHFTDIFGTVDQNKSRHFSSRCFGSRHFEIRCYGTTPNFRTV